MLKLSLSSFLLDVNVCKVMQVVDVCNRYWSVSSLPMHRGHIDILAIGVDSPGLAVIAHDFFDVAWEIGEPLLTCYVLRSWLLLVVLFLFLLIEFRQLLQMWGILDHLNKVLTTRSARDFVIFTDDDLVEGEFASVTEELLGRLHNYNNIIIYEAGSTYHNSINTWCQLALTTISPAGWD